VTPIPACRTAAKARAVGPIAARVIEISIPARSNIPPSAAKSFRMSTASAAVMAGSMVVGPGLAAIEHVRSMERLGIAMAGGAL
jgi:hypothetical protein